MAREGQTQVKKAPAAESTVPPAHSDHEDHSSIDFLEKDAAAAIVPDHAIELDKAAERRVLRKVDLFLLPLMWIGYGLVYYDKVNII